MTTVQGAKSSPRAMRMERTLYGAKPQLRHDSSSAEAGVSFEGRFPESPVPWVRLDLYERYIAAYAMDEAPGDRSVAAGLQCRPAAWFTRAPDPE